MKNDCKSLIFVLLLALPVAAQGQFTYITNADNTITITGYTSPAGNVVVPATINGLPVTSINNYAFADTALISVTIPNSVTSIGERAFYDCYSLTNVAIPDGVTSIGDEAFFGCYNITRVTMGNSVTNIGFFAFGAYYPLGLTSVFFNGNAPVVNPNAFTWYDPFGGPDTDRFKNHATIYYLTNTFGWSNTLAGHPTMMLNAPPQFGTTDDGWEYATDGVRAIVTGYAHSDAAVTIPSTINGLPVTDVGPFAFYGNGGLASVTVPNSVTRIEAFAFASDVFNGGNSSLISVVIGNSVISIGDNTFDGCWNLLSIFFSGNAPATGSSVFGSDIYDPVTIYILSGTTGWSNLFAGLPTSLWDQQSGCGYAATNGEVTITSYGASGGNVAIPAVINGQPVISIGDEAFIYNTALTGVTIPDGVTSIGTGAFAACSGLTNVTLGNGITSIGDWAFEDSGLTSVAIPDSVTSIGYEAFSQCDGLTNLSVAAENPAYSGGGGVLFDKNKTTLIQYPLGLTNGSYVIPADVTSIGDLAFCECYSLTSVTIPDSVNSIGNYAFYDCESLTGVHFSGNAPLNDGTAFADNGLATVYYLPGTTGWSSTFGGRPTALWLPQAQTSDGNFGIKNNQFGFTISWASGQTVVVEVCTNLSHPLWLPVGTNTLVSGTSYFSDPQPSNLLGRFYRLRSP